MGKVLSTFKHGSAGAIARGLDDVVIALSNKSGATIAFGVPLALDEDKAGVVPFNGATHTAADFVGVSVRNPAKTPETYGGSVGVYAANDIVDVLVRGHIVVKMTGASSAGIGDGIAINKSTGAFTVGTGDNLIPLTNAHLTTTLDGSNMAEIVLNNRNLI